MEIETPKLTSDSVNVQDIEAIFKKPLIKYKRTSKGDIILPRGPPDPWEEKLKKVVQEETANLPDVLKKTNAYMCYVLRSSVARARTYCGTTHDLIHRLRQHNGLICGGAKATSTSRPWRIAAVVYGFSDRSKALRYEWFAKCKHSKTAYNLAQREGANSIERRAALLAAAAAKCPGEDIKYYFADDYMKQCCEKGNEVDKPEESVFVAF